MKFGDRIALLREKAGLTQEELAQQLGISRAALAKYEKSLREPDYETLNKIADFFDVSIDYLLGSSRDGSSKKLDIMELERRLREGEITYKGKPLSEEQCEILADFLEVILKREKKKPRGPSS